MIKAYVNKITNPTRHSLLKSLDTLCYGFLISILIPHTTTSSYSFMKNAIKEMQFEPDDRLTFRTFAFFRNGRMTRRMN